MIPTLNLRTVVGLLLLLALVLLPVYVELTGSRFLLTLFTRIVILALAAVSLNLILGYGGMMSFGHAAYLGIGGYAVGMLAFEGITTGFVQWPVALLVSAFFAFVIGALSLRTRGVYFIMITLAFAQMAYYIVAGLARYGGDDGLTIQKRSQFIAPINLSNKVQFYYICLVLLCAAIYLVWRIVNSRFGMAIQGARSKIAHVRDRLSNLSLQTHLFCHCRDAVRTCRGAACQSHRFCQPGNDVLDALRRSHHHGCARWNGLHLRPIVRRSGAARAGGGALGHHRILADHFRAAAAFGRSLRARRIDGLLGKARHG